MRVVIIGECFQLSRQIERVPEKHVIEIFAADGADQPFDERMRNRRVRNRFDLLDREDAQVGEPAVKAKQRIVVGANVLRCRLWPAVARLNIRQAETPSMLADSTPKPTMRRVKTSMTSITQWLRRRIDSQRKRSMLQRLSLAWAINASQEGPVPPESSGR